jgi:hypothetical protein
VLFPNGIPFVVVRELMGWVRNVVLIIVYLDLEKPRESGFWVGGYMGQVSLRATWERGGRILSQQGGFQVSRKGSKRKQRGAKGSKENMPCT